MKVEERVLDVTTTLQGEKVGMTIDQSALAHIMSVLTDLYSDPELAVIREYSTNAFDAHVEAGQKRPIEVTLPSALSPFLKIKDYGVGLNAEDIREIYSRYGTSTKRDSNDVVGMLGLGCKSALTYTDQFTLTGVKDGMRVVVAVSRDEDGAGSMTIVESHPTDEPTGVEVTIPAKQGNRFEEKAAGFFRFWTKGTVLVNGVEPERIDGLWIADDLLLTTKCDESMVVMGNVAYPMGESGYSRYRLVAFVEIGDVHFTPSREALQMTPKTKATIKSLRERENKERDAALQKMIDEAPTYWDAIKIGSQARSFGLSKHPVYKGEEVPQLYSGLGKVVVVDPAPRYRSKGWSESSQVHAHSDAVWIVNYDSDAFTPYKREKLNQWREKQSEEIKGAGVYVFTRASAPAGHLPGVRTHAADGTSTVGPPKSLAKWIDPKRVVDWSDIKAEKIKREARAERSDGRPRGAYDVWVGSDRRPGTDAGSIDTSKPLFWYHGGQWSNPPGHSMLLAKHPDATVVCLAANRIEKFKRDFPMAKSCTDVVREEAKRFTDSITSDMLEAIVVHGTRHHQFLRDLDPAKLDDPELAKAARIARRKGVEETLSKLKSFKRVIGDLADPKYPKWDNPLDKYPLIRYMNYLNNTERTHLYLYLNAAYAARMAQA